MLRLNFEFTVLICARPHASAGLEVTELKKGSRWSARAVVLDDPMNLFEARHGSSIQFSVAAQTNVLRRQSVLCPVPLSKVQRIISRGKAGHLHFTLLPHHGGLNGNPGIAKNTGAQIGLYRPSHFRVSVEKFYMHRWNRREIEVSSKAVTRTNQQCAGILGIACARIISNRIGSIQRRIDIRSGSRRSTIAHACLLQKASIPG